MNTPHTKEPRAAPGAGNCIQNWSWLRGRYNHTTQENTQRKYKNVVVGKAPTETMNPKMTSEEKEAV